jgi:hypothetical protein
MFYNIGAVLMDYLQVTNDARTRAVVESIRSDSDGYWTVDWTLYSPSDEIFAAGTTTVTGLDYGGLLFRDSIEDDLCESTKETLLDAVWLAWLRATRQSREDARRRLDFIRSQRGATYAT